MKLLKLIKLRLELALAMLLTPCEADWDCRWEADTRRRINEIKKL